MPSKSDVNIDLGLLDPSELRRRIRCTVGQTDAEERREDRRESWFVAAGIGIFLAGFVLGILACKI